MWIGPAMGNFAAGIDKTPKPFVFGYKLGSRISELIMWS